MKTLIQPQWEDHGLSTDPEADSERWAQSIQTQVERAMVQFSCYAFQPERLPTSI